MRKKNTSDRQKLKTKYTIQKKRKQRKIKIKRDMKKNPNKYHKKKADPGVPNSAPFKLAILNERDRYMQKKEEERQKRRDEILKAREAMRNTKVGEKRKLTDVLDLGDSKNEKDSGNSSDDDETFQYADEEMRLRRIAGHPVSERNSDDNDSDEDGDEKMEEDEAPKKPENPAVLLARKAKQAHFEFKSMMGDYKNEVEKSDPDPRWVNLKSDKAHYRRVKEVVEAADVILEVLDARDPQGTRCPLIESNVRNKKKKLVFILNKADLVPKSNLQAWLKFLRSEAPCVAFKAATPRTKKFKKSLERMKHLGEESLRTSLTMGADVLMQLMKNYARSYPMGISVGVVGLPNVGKSSLVNSLKKVKACEVAPMPGCTKFIKEIKLDKKLRMIDSPGVVLPSRDMDPVEAVLKNVIRIANVPNLRDCGVEIFKRSDSLKLALFYGVPKKETGEEFLTALAKRFKMYNSSGIVNLEAAAKKLIYDWNHGVLKYYTEPPKFNENEVKSKVVSSLAPAFDLDSLAGNKEEAFLRHIDEGRPSITMKLVPNAPVQHIHQFDEDEWASNAPNAEETASMEENMEEETVQ